ncbi:MAG: four helix bundle protein [Candidatus Hydrogenedentes bacterium]|nr:four helix bundle protein [Candidatus Hydrogenedentota bacterium]
MGMKSYRDLEVWKQAMDMVVAVYGLTGEFPAQEKYGLASQMQRAAVSVPANIAEGYARLHRGDYVHHLSMARGSLAELETHITLAVRLEYVPREKAVEIWNTTQEVGKMLTGLISSLRRPSKGSLPPSQTLNPRP